MSVDKKARDLVKKEGRQKKANFAKSLIKAEVQGSMLQEAYKGLVRTYKVLGVSNESYMKLVDKTTVQCEWLTYHYYEAQIAYFKVCSEMEKAKALDDFETAKRKVIIRM